jgi:hypothetical protein
MGALRKCYFSPFYFYTNCDTWYPLTPNSLSRTVCENIWGPQSSGESVASPFWHIRNTESCTTVPSDCKAPEPVRQPCIMNSITRTSEGLAMHIQRAYIPINCSNYLCEGNDRRYKPRTAAVSHQRHSSRKLDAWNSVHLVTAVLARCIVWIRLGTAWCFLQRGRNEGAGLHIFIVPPCMLSSYSIITPTTAYIYIYIYKIYKILHIKTLKTLRHISVLRPSSGSYMFLAKVTLEIVTY